MIGRPTVDGGGDRAGAAAPLHAGRLADGREVRVYDSLAALSEAGAALVAGVLAEAAAARGRALLSLAGGTTPRTLYERLATAHQGDVPWERTVVAFGDERCVPPTSDSSNFRMAADTLLGRVPVQRELVHRVRGELLPEDAAADYDRTVRGLSSAGAMDDRPAHALRAPLFDVTILGMGADGHTASLFPGSAALGERDRWAVAVTAPESAPGPPERVTLTLPVLAASRLVLFLVTGEAKRTASHAALLEHMASTAERPPAGQVRGMGQTIWLLDRAAAGEELVRALV